MAQAAEMGTRSLSAPGAATAPSAVLMSDRRLGPDLWGVGEAMRPLAELCVAPAAETPFAVGLVGGPGSGKSFALRRLIEAIESRARAPALTKVVVATVDAASAVGEPEVAIAAAVHAALDGENGNFAQFADEAVHAAVDPRHAAAAAAERHDEIVGRLEQERRARDEVEARRARIVDSVLYETPGARIDAFARARRSAIDARLKRFGFTEGDADLNYRSLVRDLAGLRAGSRVGLFLRAIWAYRGQVRLLFLGVVAFALAYGLDWIRAPGTQDSLLALYAQSASAIDWVRAHDQALQYAVDALIALGALAVCLNLWRAARFTGLLYRGLGLLNMDVRERRRELDVSSARLERRVAALQIEGDAANQRAETMARRAGGAPTNRAPGPAFLSPADGPAQAAREFLRALGRSSAVAAPERVVIAIDGLDALPPAEARRFLETAVRAAGPKVAVIAAIDLGRFDDPRGVAEALFEAVYDVEGFAGAAGDKVAARLLSPPTTAPAPLGETKGSGLAEPLSEDEQRRLRAASGLIGPRPRALKRFYNAYRLARTSEGPRAATALSLAALMSGDRGLVAAWREMLSGEGETLEARDVPPALRAAFEALGLQGVSKQAAAASLASACRYAPWG